MATQAELDDHINDTVAAHAGTAVGNTPAGNINATNVQAAINELDTEKVAKSGDTVTGPLNLPSNGLAVGTNQLVVSGGNVGIGTASPTAKLDVRGEVIGGNGTVQAALSFSSRAEIGAKSNHNLGLIANNVTHALLDTSGNFTLITGGGLGYGVGSGGTATQPAGSKGNDVTLNKPSGQITMDNATLNANTRTGFALFNSVLAAGDAMTCTVVGGAADSRSYEVYVAYVGPPGLALIQVENISGGALSEAIVLSFTVHKGATS